MDRDGFQIVSRKRSNKRCRHVPVNIAFQEDQMGSLCCGEIEKKLNHCRSEVKQSELWPSLKETINKWCMSCKHNVCTESSTNSDNYLIKEIVCYGVGQFASQMIARYQLALLLLMQKELHVEKCYIYDPVFSETEQVFLEKENLHVLRHNEEGKRKATDKTLFFMPHCGRPLYNNLLWSNWNPESLNQIAIVGNSFNFIHDSTPHRILNQEAIYIEKILRFTLETPLNNTFIHSDVFNNTSVHVFNTGDIEDTMWNDAPEPVYKNDIEIIVNK